jgi:hypothetical protein
MAQKAPDRDVPLPGLAEFRPDRGDRSVQVEQPALDEQRCAYRHRTLGRRKDDLEAVRPIPGSTPDVYLGIAVDVHTQGGSEARPTR